MKRIVYLLGLWIFSSQLSMALTLSSPAFQQGEAIPPLYTCEGANVSPPLSWRDIPPGVRSYVITLEDLDTQQHLGFAIIHWVLFDIPGMRTSISPNPVVGKRGINGFNKVNYEGPCPPPNAGLHHYVFKIYALDIPVLQLAQGASWEEVSEEIKNHVMEMAQLTGTYQISR